ncbi:MAG: magnesium/cobalt transporter CorA [Vicingaceae bacterium]
MKKSDDVISKKAGLPPGALVHVGKRKTEHVKITVIDYDRDHFEQRELASVEECKPYSESASVSWINVDGLHDIPTIEAIGNQFSLHPLLLEDVLNTRHRPKTEEFEEYMFVVLKMLGVSEDRATVVSEQVSFVLGPKFLISFQEEEGDIFDDFRKRLSSGQAQARGLGSDYLLYRLIDTVVDNYFVVVEHISDDVLQLEEVVLDNPDQHVLQGIQLAKKKLIQARKSIGPLREAISILEKDGGKLIAKKTTRHLRDVYEHVIQVNENIENQRDMVSTLMDLYMSGMSNKMNQVMKVLTIISTIFIPMTFIAGIYGMNFENMPELHWQNGYFYSLAAMLVILIGMLFYFKHKDWL